MKSANVVAHDTLHEPVSVLRVQRLTKVFAGPAGPVTALDDVSLAVGPGEILCLLGANGAGKTTTINCLLGFVTPTSGHAYVNGLDVGLEPLRSKQRLAYIPELVMLYFAELTLERKVEREELRGHLAEAGLPATAYDRAVGTYSKGMRQKVGIALALARTATALVLDEPTSGLDPQASNEFSLLLRKLSDAGAGVLMATHDLFRAKETGTHVAIMRQGSVLAQHRTDELSHADIEQLYLEHMR